MHLFDAAGGEKVIPYPEGGQGTYSFTPALEDGFAWAVHTGGIITRIDVDRGAYDFVEPVPLKAINWGAAITPEGFLVCESSGNPPRGEVLVYDTLKRRVAHLFAPISVSGNLYGHYPRAAPDGCVVLPLWCPGVELIRIDPRTGKHESFQPRAATRDGYSRAITFLPDGRLAFPRGDRIATVTYPDFRDAEPLPYPDARPTGWRTFRDYGDGRLFAYHAEGGPLYALSNSGAWTAHLDRFTPGFAPKLANALADMFCALPGRRLLGLSMFGEVLLYEADGSGKIIAQLKNDGYQHFNCLQPADDATVFTTTFINMSFQQLDTRTGRGRNIRPCQVHGGQVTGTAWQAGKLWLVCYGGAELSVYDPKLGGEWPQNPRHVLDLGAEQMRPLGLAGDGRYLWTVTNAQYGKLGGALARIDPQAETCKVWRELLADHNPTGLRLDAEARRVYLGTTIYADCNSAPPGKIPAALIAFDLDREAPAWIARPVPDAVALRILALPSPDLILVAADPGYPSELLLLDAAAGKIRRRFDPKLPKDMGNVSFLVAGNRELYLACNRGLFRYDLESGLGAQLLATPISLPAARGNDLFFIQGHELGIAENVFG
jgi:hypothetical protein